MERSAGFVSDSFLGSVNSKEEPSVFIMQMNSGGAVDNKGTIICGLTKSSIRRRKKCRLKGKLVA